jgi:hypothetical protein
MSTILTDSVQFRSALLWQVLLCSRLLLPAYVVSKMTLRGPRSRHFRTRFAPLGPFFLWAICPSKHRLLYVNTRIHQDFGGNLR